jgi:hypothetical protein
MNKDEEEYVSAADLVRLIKSNAERLESLAPHRVSDAVPGFRVADLKKVPLLHFRTAAKVPLLEKELEELARNEIERGEKAAKVAMEIVKSANKGDLDAETYLEQISKSPDRTLTESALSAVRTGAMPVTSPFTRDPYLDQLSSDLPEFIPGRKAQRISIKVLGPGEKDVEVRTRVADSKEYTDFWLAAGTDRLILEVPDETTRAALLLSALLGHSLEVELSVKIPMPRKGGAMAPLRATIVSAIDIRAIAAGLAERFHLQLKIFE